MSAELSVREYELAIPGMRVAGRLWAWGDARERLPVLALHGFQDNAASFDVLVPALHGAAAAPPMQVLAIDLAGHGQSSWRSPGVGYFVMDYAADALAVADAMGWERFAVIGHSLGAGIATLLGGAVPERLSGAVLIDGLGPVSMAPGAGPRLAARAFSERAKLRARVADGRGRALATLEEAADIRAGARIAIERDAARRLVGRGTRPDASGGWAWSADPHLARTSFSRLTEDTVLAYLGAMQVPTLLFEADDGVLHSLPAERYAARVAAHPQLSRCGLPGRHHLHMEASATPLAERTASFLRAHGGRPTG
ncbi:MAG: alpha/beta fold hydrolase [Pseudomonadota bacterium]